MPACCLPTSDCRQRAIPVKKRNPCFVHLISDSNRFTCPQPLLQGRAYEYGLETLRGQGVPVEGLRFDPGLVIRGLIMDKEYGNLIKVDRFG